MQSLNDLASGMLEKMDARDRAREEALALSRTAIRHCSISIRAIHKGNLEEAKNSMAEARINLDKAREVLKDHSDIRHAGFVDNAEQEYAEATNVFSITTRHEVLSPEEIGVDLANYLSGLGDVTGELRRHILDLIREGRPKEGEYYLDTMEEIFHLLMLFDYPDALTHGLRRKSDLARSMLERTRGDLTNAMEMTRVGDSLRKLEDKLKDPGSKV